MPRYLIKKTSGRFIDHITIRKGTKNTKGLVDKWKKQGYKEVYARSPNEAIEKALGVKVVRKRKA